MFLRKTPRKKDGKTHDYWSVVENKRVAGGRVVQRHVLYLGEINSSQAAVWRKAIEGLDDDAGHRKRCPTTLQNLTDSGWPFGRPVPRHQFVDAFLRPAIHQTRQQVSEICLGIGAIQLAGLN